MPLFGTLNTMPLPDLLQWLGTARRSGTLQVERERVRKWILFRDGQIFGCSSDDPPERLGHYLLSRGRITEDQLRIALKAQEGSNKFLGRLFIEMGVITDDELNAHLEAKAEETIYSLFDWNDAVFRFHEEMTDQPQGFPVSLRVEDVLLRGMQRYDEMQRIRTVFNDPGIVLRRTDHVPPDQVLQAGTARTLYDSIDGERTVAEILLHVHGSEYLVKKFLYELHRNDFIEIAGIKSVATVPEPAGVASSTPDARPPLEATSAIEAPAATWALARNRKRRSPRWLDGLGAAPPAAVESDGDRDLGNRSTVAHVDAAIAEEVDESDDTLASQMVAGLLDDSLDFDSPGVIDAPPTPEVATPPGVPRTADPAPGTPPESGPAAEDDEHILDIPDMFVEDGADPVSQSDAFQLANELETVRDQMRNGSFDLALGTLEVLYQRNPDDESLRRLIAEAEAAFCDKAYRHYLPADRIVGLTRPLDELQSDANLSPSEFFLLSRIDGTWDVRSIIQIAPLREVDALMTLKRLRENGIIELTERPQR